MNFQRSKIELLSPARDLACGIGAVNHGADAVYIGGPAFGARSAAANSVSDIERLASHAHRFGAKVYVTLNTILTDQELLKARKLGREVWEAGADALIIQDMGLLLADLVPIPLHASTQCDNRTPEKVRFLEDVGFSQVVLARELTLGQIREISRQTSVKLEFFIHGALCVGVSGQCHLSMRLSGRSANRGECAQPCRLKGYLADEEGNRLSPETHLLSLKDMNQTANLEKLIRAGISSFKIEGRLKEEGYVKNVTAHYRRKLDAILDSDGGLKRASVGRTRFFFDPAPEKTFNRGKTAYFVDSSPGDFTHFRTPKHLGEEVGKVSKRGGEWFEVKSRIELHNGDGLTFFDETGELTGFNVNKTEGGKIYPSSPSLVPQVGAMLYRNADKEFEKTLLGDSAERRLLVDMVLRETQSGYSLLLVDEGGRESVCEVPSPKEAARDPDKAVLAIKKQLTKLGATILAPGEVTVDLSSPRFIQPSILNDLRRRCTEELLALPFPDIPRETRRSEVVPPPKFPQETLTHQGNVLNSAAREFYLAHGVVEIADAFETQKGGGEAELMVTKHCLRRAFNLCPSRDGAESSAPLKLHLGKRKFTVIFDCAACEMRILG